MKRLTPVTKEIGEYTFYIRPFSAFTAANMTGDLANVATPILAALAPLVVKAVGAPDRKVLDTDVADMAPSMQGAFSGLSGDKLERLSMKLLIENKNISVEGPEIDKAKLLTKDLADELFCGEVEDMFVLMWYVIQINFSGFFRKLAARFGLVGELFQKAQTTQNSVPLT